MRVPTVRVVNPADPGRFMTINAADHRDEHHELWPEQAEGFDPADLRRPAAAGALDPALRDAAAALCLRMVALKRRVGGEPFAELTLAEQLAVLQKMGAEVDQAEAAYGDDQRERAAFEDRQRAAQADQAETGRGRADQRAEDGGGALRVAKGPGGRWYVYRGTERAARGFATEDEAQRYIAEKGSA